MRPFVGPVEISINGAVCGEAMDVLFTPDDVSVSPSCAADIRTPAERQWPHALRNHLRRELQVVKWTAPIPLRAWVINPGPHPLTIWGVDVPANTRIEFLRRKTIILAAWRIIPS